MRRGPSLATLLFGVNAFFLLGPLLAFVGLRVYETMLLRQTERLLIAQAVVVAEAYREAWLGARGLAKGAPTPDFRPPEKSDEPFIPIEPVIDPLYGILPAQTTTLPNEGTSDSPERRAGATIEPLLRRMQVFNLSAVRILDGQGCVVATSRGNVGQCLGELSEVRSALAGRYDAVARARITDEPLPPLSDVRSRGSIRVFSALPVFSNGVVIGVVCASRTSMDALTSLWHDRRGFLLAGTLTLVGLLAVSLWFAMLIARPTRQITRAADAIAAGATPRPWVPSPWTPREVRALHEALTTMARQLRGRAEEIAEWAATLSHELKTPLAGIRGAVELLAEGWQTMPEAQRQRFLANVDADAVRMERLVTRLLELTRIESAPLARADVEVPELLCALAERYGERVRFSVGELPARRPLTAEHLSTAVTNLIENALRHGAAPVEVSADTLVGADGSRLRICVRDRGPGISVGNQPRIFTRFFTTDRDGGGTGLGLATVKSIVTRYGGEVTFTSGAEGTAFVLVV